MINWTTELRQIKDLKPHPKNPRKLSKHDAENLQKSIEKFGLIDKPIITRENLIIGGHQRIAILKKMGNKPTDWVECYVPDRDMSDKDIEHLMISLNRVHGEWDWDLLANNFETENLIDYGFSNEELHIDPIQDLGSNDEPKKSGKKKVCPSCGHEFT